MCCLFTRWRSGYSQVRGPRSSSRPLWAVHPVLTESVANIVGRADLLAAAGVLGGFLMYLKSVETEGWRRIGVARRIGVGHGCRSLFEGKRGILPGVIVLYDSAVRVTKPGRCALAGLLATLVPVALMLAMRASVLAGTQMEIPFTDNPIAWVDFRTGRLTALTVMAREFALMFWPANLSADYSWWQYRSRMAARPTGLSSHWRSPLFPQRSSCTVGTATILLLRGGTGVAGAVFESAVPDRHNHGGAATLPARAGSGGFRGGGHLCHRGPNRGLALCSAIAGRADAGAGCPDMGPECRLEGRYEYGVQPGPHQPGQLQGARSTGQRSFRWPIPPTAISTG